MGYTKRSANYNDAGPLYSDASFRAFFTMIDSALLANGYVATTDTGQFNLTTGTVPTTINDFTKFRIYALADNGVNGLPTYLLKITINSINQLSNLGIQLLVCSATNGAGIPTSAFQFCSIGFNESTSNTASMRYMDFLTCSNSGSDLWFYLGNGTESRSLFFSLVRTKNPTTFIKDNRGLILSCRSTIGYSTVAGDTRVQQTLMVGPNCESQILIPRVFCGAPCWGSGSGTNSISVYPSTEYQDPSNYTMGGCYYFIRDIPLRMYTQDLTINGQTLSHKFSGFMPMQDGNVQLHWLNNNNTETISTTANAWGVAFPFTGTTV